MIIRLAAFLLFTIHVTSAASIFQQASKGKCQRIEIPLCMDAPYNYTYVPNSFLQQDQASLASQTDHFKPLIKTKCNRHIKFFICSVFAPMCPEAVPQEVTSCRSVCQQVKKDCQSILDEFGIGWPDLLECDKFPEDSKNLCMDPDQDHNNPDRGHGSSLRVRPSLSLACPADLVDVDPADPRAVCASKCGADVMFTSQDKEAARGWMLWLGGLDAAVSLFTFLTFLIDTGRFRYPERCVFYLSLSYLMYSIPNLFPLFLQYSVRACDRQSNGDLFVVHSGMDNTPCLLSFLLSYYFAIAAALWWLMFAFTWYLSAVRKWVPEGIDSCASYVHLVVWGISALCTIAVLVMHRIDASELTGVCSVGQTEPWSLMFLSLVPRTTLVVLGACFVIAGFSSMCRERDAFRRRGTDTSKLEKLMVKMFTFCALYLVPTVISLVCDAYHYLTLRQWYPATLGCKSHGGGARCQRPELPQTEFYWLGLLMSMAAGLCCAMWILSPKTLLAWQRFLCCGMCSPAPQKAVSSAAARPLLEPPSAPPPQPPSSAAYLPMSTHSHQVWRPSKVI